jgi:hypothetical protein
MNYKQHISSIRRTCFHNTHRLRQIRHYTSASMLPLNMVSALVTSRLDYCNSILTGLPATMTAPLQRVQNATVKLVFNLRPPDNATPAVLQPHCTGCRFTSTDYCYKLCVLMFQAHSGLLPSYQSQTLINWCRPLCDDLDCTLSVHFIIQHSATTML